MTKTVRPRKLAPAFQWASDVAHLRNGAHEKSVALALVAHTTDLRTDLPVYPSNETICAFTGLDDSAVRKGLRALEAAGLVRREARPRQPSLIWLTRVGSTPHDDRRPGSAQPPTNDSDGGSVQPPSRGVRSTRVESSSMGGSFNPGSRCDSTRVGSTPQSPDSDHENQNQNPPILSSRSEVRPARESDPAPTETRGPESISSTGTESRDESETAEAGAPVRVVASHASRPTAAELAFGADLIRGTWIRPADRDLSLDEERAVSALHKAIGDRDIERAELAWGRVEIARLGAHVATMPIREVMMARTNVAAALNGKLPPPPMTDEERRERMARLLAATAEKRGDAAPALPPTPAELPPESQRRIAEVMGTRAPLSGAALDAHNAAVRARAVASYGEEAVAEIERRHATIRARAAAELAERRGSTRTRVTS